MLYSYHKLLRLSGGCFVLRLPVAIPWFLFVSSIVSSVCHIPCGEARHFSSSIFFPFSLSIYFLFVFGVLCFLSFSLFHIQYDNWHCIALCAYCIPVRNNVQY